MVYVEIVFYGNIMQKRAKHTNNKSIIGTSFGDNLI